MFYVFSSHSFWTSSSLDIPAVVTQEEGHTGFLIHLSAVRAFIFLAKRIQPFLSLVDREVEFCVLTIQSFSILPYISNLVTIESYTLNNVRLKQTRAYHVSDPTNAEESL